MKNIQEIIITSCLSMILVGFPPVVAADGDATTQIPRIMTNHQKKATSQVLKLSSHQMDRINAGGEIIVIKSGLDIVNRQIKGDPPAKMLITPSQINRVVVCLNCASLPE